VEKVKWSEYFSKGTVWSARRADATLSQMEYHDLTHDLHLTAWKGNQQADSTNPQSTRKKTHI
jgi:hypothetical protein